MTDWNTVSQNMWNAILGHVRDLKGNGETLQAIAKKIGVNSHSVIRSWLTGDRKAEGTSFALLMTYLERCGLDYMDFFPSVSEAREMTVARCQARVRELEAQVRALEVFRHKWEGHLEALAAQSGGHPVKKMAS